MGMPESSGLSRRMPCKRSHLAPGLAVRTVACFAIRCFPIFGRRTTILARVTLAQTTNIKTDKLPKMVQRRRETS